MGPGSRVCHVLDDFVNYNAILGTRGNGRARSIVHFLSLGGGGIEKVVIVEVVKYNFP